MQGIGFPIGRGTRIGRAASSRFKAAMNRADVPNFGRSPVVDTTGKSTASPVQARQLSKSYGKGHTRVTALDDVSLEVRRGEMVAIIGASGSGKSTLLHLIAGLTTPTSGAVLIDGQDLAPLNDRKLTIFRRQRLGLVFQAFNLIPTLSMEDNILLPLLMEKAGKPDARHMEELLDLLGLKERRHHRPDQLSGGEQQRVAIGRALINNPSVLLADEPTGNLDSVNSQKFCELLHRLSREQQRTVVVVTHDAAVSAWADRVLVLRDGRIVKELEKSDYPTARDLSMRFQELMAAPRGTASREEAACV
jgi:putative ABC transport system ATP-binding protein